MPDEYPKRADTPPPVRLDIVPGSEMNAVERLPTISEMEALSLPGSQALPISHPQPSAASTRFHIPRCVLMLFKVRVGAEYHIPRASYIPRRSYWQHQPHRACDSLGGATTELKHVYRKYIAGTLQISAAARILRGLSSSIASRAKITLDSLGRCSIIYMGQFGTGKGRVYVYSSRVAIRYGGFGIIIHELVRLSRNNIHPFYNSFATLHFRLSHLQTKPQSRQCCDPHSPAAHSAESATHHCPRSTSCSSSGSTQNVSSPQVHSYNYLHESPKPV